MNTEIEVERTARILKQADPGHSTRGGPGPNAEPAPTLVIAIIAGIVAFVAIIVAVCVR